MARIDATVKMYSSSAAVGTSEFRYSICCKINGLNIYLELIPAALIIIKTYFQYYLNEKINI